MLQNHTNEEKGKEKKIEKGRARRRKGGEEKKAMIATLVFKVTLDAKGPFCDNVIKNLAGHL